MVFKCEDFTDFAQGPKIDAFDVKSFVERLSKLRPARVHGSLSNNIVLSKSDLKVLPPSVIYGKQDYLLFGADDDMLEA